MDWTTANAIVRAGGRIPESWFDEIPVPQGRHEKIARVLDKMSKGPDAFQVFVITATWSGLYDYVGRDSWRLELEHPDTAERRKVWLGEIAVIEIRELP